MKRFIFTKAVTGLALAGLCTTAEASDSCDLKDWPQDKTEVEIVFRPGQMGIEEDNRPILDRFLENTQALRKKCGYEARVVVSAGAVLDGVVRCTSVGKALAFQENAEKPPAKLARCKAEVRVSTAAPMVQVHTARIFIDRKSEKTNKKPPTRVPKGSI